MLWQCKKNPLCVHLEVYEGVDGRVGHGEPEEGEKDVLRARVSARVLKERGDNERLYYLISLICIRLCLKVISPF